MSRTSAAGGFTLIEIVIVIAAIGVLAVVGIPKFIDLRQEATQRQEAGVVGAVRTGIGNYAAESQVKGRTPLYAATLDSAGPGEASPANPFYTEVLASGITNSWSKIGLVYRGPTDTEYRYDPALGTFSAVTHPSGYLYGWSMDEGSGTGVGEGSFAGTISGATWIDGVVGDALRFDGNRGHVHIPDSSALDLTTAGTMQAWVYADVLTNYAGIIHKGDAGNFSDEAYSLQYWTGKHIAMGLKDTGGTDRMLVTNTVFQPGQWYHVAATWDPSGMRVYVNGVLDNSNTRAVTVMTTSGGLNIGAQTETNNSTANRNFPFRGAIDEAQVYNRALTAAEIQQYYSSIQP